MKKIITVLLTFTIICAMIGCVFALPDGLTSIDPNSAPDELQTAGQKILGAIQWVGYAFAIGMLIYIGIKYTMAAANEKANLKNGAINYIVGAIVIAGAVTICSWFVNFGRQITNGGVAATGEQKVEEQKQPDIHN